MCISIIPKPMRAVIEDEIPYIDLLVLNFPNGTEICNYEFGYDYKDFYLKIILDYFNDYYVTEYQASSTGLVIFYLQEDIPVDKLREFLDEAVFRIRRKFNIRD